MGRVKTKLIKRTSFKLFKENKAKCTIDFTHNKGVVQELLHSPNKKLRNTVAGYLSRLVKQDKQ